MDFKFAVHTISRETTTFGGALLQGFLTDLYLSNSVNEVILVDNGNNPKTKNVIKEAKLKFESKGATFKIIDYPKRTTFSELRNMALRLADPKTDFFSWFDVDEAFFPEQLQSVVNTLKAEKAQGKMFNKINTFFRHFMIEPNLYYTKECEAEPRYNIIKYNPNLRWIQTVHERLEGYEDPSDVKDSGMIYHHFGYVKQVPIRFLIWMQYAKLANGSVNEYKEENDNGVIKPWFRDWRATPENILDDRRAYCKEFTGRYTPGTEAAWRASYTQSKLSWKDWLAMVDPEANQLWISWQELYKQKGNWADTLDPMLELYEKQDGTNI